MSDSSDRAEFARRFSQVRRAVSSLEKKLLGGTREYSRRDLEEKFSIPPTLSRMYWRALGFTNVDDDTAVFTAADAEAFSSLKEVSGNDIVSDRSLAHLARALGFHMGRLAMWETEAIVDDMKRARNLPDAEARLAMLDVMPSYIDVFEQHVLYAFRRQLAAYTARAGAEILQSSPDSEGDDAMPLKRVVGFADLVAFTPLAQSLSGAELADVIGDFEAITRDIVSVGGGRVVKTVGDEIMFLADTPEDGAQIALSISEALAEDDRFPCVRIGLSWGNMFSRFGDVFGPTVNLAARLEGIAAPGEVICDEDTADAIEEALPGAFVTSRKEAVELQGIGKWVPVSVKRGNSRRIELDG
ncbi:adenylate/guanylate cyclase domain-containing protein [Dermabacteraceae bacterium P7074]